MSSPPAATHPEPPAGPRPGQLTAMISSTVRDLPEHRALAHEACLEAGFFPLSMEQLPGRDATGVDVSLELVDLADIYIGIYAYRYGWVPEGQETSVTEMEFDRALARKAEKKLSEILVFVAHEKHLFTFADIEIDKAAQDKLGKLKERAAGRVRKEFKSAEELHRLIYQALSEFKVRRQRAAAAAAGTRPARDAIPNNLPRLPSFFGREAELAQIREALAPENPTWGTLIDGSGGMGKTTLAVRAAYECKPGQFKRIVFVSVKNRVLDDDGVRELGASVLPGFLEMLNELSRELGRADILKAPEDERVRLLLEALRDGQVLLILDNLESLTKSDRDLLLGFVEQLPQGCKAVLTSREPFGNVGGGFRLEQLSRDAALAMLADLAEHSKLLAKTSEEERVALYEHANGNPLLLRWAAGQLGREGRRSMADALAFLSSCPKDNPLEFVFGDLVKEFNEDETSVLCALTYFTLPAKVDHIAPVAGRGVEPTEAAVSSLANRSLVLPDSEDMTFTLVPVVADLLRRLMPGAIAESGDRLEKHVYALALENGYGKFKNFHVLNAAWPATAAALPRFLAGPNRELQIVSVALQKYLEYYGRWDELLAFSRDAEERAVDAGDYWNAGWRAYAAGWVYYLRQQSSEVFACAERTDARWRMFQGYQGDFERATILRLRGLGHHLEKAYPKAIEALREAVGLFRISSPGGGDLARTLEALADAERRFGELDAAERDYREALQIFEAADEHEGIASSTGNLAALALDREDWSGAESLASKALSLSADVGRMELIASNCRRLARALIRQGRGPDALPHARRSVEIYSALRSPDLGEARQTLAECES